MGAAGLSHVFSCHLRLRMTAAAAMTVTMTTTGMSVLVIPTGMSLSVMIAGDTCIDQFPVQILFNRFVHISGGTCAQFDAGFL